ncbi:transposase [Paenibacillus larvae]|nr:transposase [Paenibacillus larvae]
MLFEDESMIRDYQAIQGMVPSREATHHSNHGQASWGQTAGHDLTMKRDTSFGKKMNSTPLKRFLSFLQKVMATYPTGNWLWFWTMPGGFIMQSTSAVSGSAKNRLELVYLPPYSPQLNIVEGLWEMAQVQCDQ